MRVITVVGARPQFVKAAVVSRALAEIGGVRESIVHTGQHFDKNMSDIFFSELRIPVPEHNLGIGGGTHGQNTGRMIEALETVFLSEKPDACLVYGDTDSTLAAAVSSAKLGIPVVHIEAGLRSFNRSMPEEINRVLTDHVSDLLFAPTQVAVDNLIREGIEEGKVFNVGDVMYDAAKNFGGIDNSGSFEITGLLAECRNYVLLTLHRKENTMTRERLADLMTGVSLFSNEVIWPIHPRTRSVLKEFGLEIPKNVRSIDPVGYVDMLKLERSASVIATDSGGVQKEAYFQRVPCVTLRTETEWIELVDSGWNRLAPQGGLELAHVVNGAVGTRGQNVEMYGGGDASRRIAEFISDMAINN